VGATAARITTMTNGDLNPPDHPLHFDNDRKQARIAFVGMAVAVIIAVILIFMTFR
jgi:hypothetical protein